MAVLPPSFNKMDSKVRVTFIRFFCSNSILEVNVEVVLLVESGL